jgi:hypothetical protein
MQNCRSDFVELFLKTFFPSSHDDKIECCILAETEMKFEAMIYIDKKKKRYLSFNIAKINYCNDLAKPNNNKSSFSNHNFVNRCNRKK